MGRFAQQLRKLLVQSCGVRAQDHLLVAVSGGADSVCLLHVLHALSPSLHTTLSCVHVHHGIRGEAADADARFVQTLCDEWRIPLTVRRADAKAYAAAHTHVSLEEAARTLRYEALRKEAEAVKRAHKTGQEAFRVFVCTAHNADDNAETVLLHLFRGTGLKGLSGIPPLREGMFLRPLLGFTRREIEAYNRACGLSFVEDETNRDTDYARNAIRHIILPAVRQHVNTKAAAHITAAADDARQSLRILEREVRLAYARCGTKQGSLRVRALCEEDACLQGEIIRLWLSEKAAGTKDITRTHIRDILALAHGKNGRAQLSLPQGLTVSRLHDDLTVCLLEKEADR